MTSSTVDTMDWQDPPPKRSPAYKQMVRYDAIADELRAYPGRWALIEKSAKAGGSSPLKRRGCEVRTVQVDDKGKVVDVYARWLPDESPNGDG